MMIRMRHLSLVGTVVMFIVVLMGAWVTTTDSGDGCGAHWPLCHGTFMPDWDYPAIVEFSHRVVAGLAGLISLILLVWILRSLRGERRIRRLATATFLLVSLQGALGAAAVIWPQPDLVLALHFGFSLLCFTFSLLTTVALYQREAGLSGGQVRRGAQVVGVPWAQAPSSFRSLVWGIAIYSYLVIYLGAYVRHLGASMACTGWPLCNGQLWPSLYGPVGANFAHRLGAALAVVLVVRLWLQARALVDQPELRRAANWLLLLILAQVVSGALFPLGFYNLLTQILHTGLIALYWGVLSYLAYLVVPAGRRAVAVTA